jgi:hypothetical protein
MIGNNSKVSKLREVLHYELKRETKYQPIFSILPQVQSVKIFEHLLYGIVLYHSTVETCGFSGMCINIEGFNVEILRKKLNYLFLNKSISLISNDESTCIPFRTRIQLPWQKETELCQIC